MKERVEVRRLRGWLPSGGTTRFAPSPTGHLHLGHVVNAIYVWGLARALGGRVLLRLEDHDRGRCRADYADAILDDLEWLGLTPDAPSTTSLRSGASPSPFRQSDNTAHYDAALACLRASGTVFACDCTRRTLASLAPGAPPHHEVPYSGRCLSRGLADGPGRGLRLLLPPGIERFEDARLGPQAQAPSDQCGALLLRDRLGQWTYQFAVVVDDLRHEVDLVIRGEDLLASTGRQLALARALGAPGPPCYLHHPLVFRDDGLKLSKANRDAGIRELRAAGWAPDAVLGHAAHAVGLQATPAAIPAEDLARLFNEEGQG